MKTLLNFKDRLKEFISKYDAIVTPAFKFIMAFILFWSLSYSFGYSSIFNRPIVIIVLSLLCAFVSGNIMLLIGGVVTCFHCFSLSLDVALLYVVMFAIVYFLYIRFSPNCAYIIMFAPVLYILKLHYLLPIIVGIFAGPVGIVPVIGGVVLFYFSQYAAQLSELLKTATEEDSVQGYCYIANAMVADKKMLLTIVVFAIVIMVTHLIYRSSFKNSWYVAIGVGGVLSMMLLLIGGFALEAYTDIGVIILGSIVGIVVAVIVQFFKGVVDYNRTEVVQFEDDDYYYYVKAVPKMKVSAENVNVKKINTRD